MRAYLLAAAAIAAVSSPAAAQPYLGIEGGILFPKSQDGDASVVYTTTQTPAAPLIAPVGTNGSFNNAYGLDYKRGSDIDLIAGYDFGMFRLEAELGRKRASLDEFSIDDGYISSLNTALNRPSAAQDPGAPGLAALSDADFDLSGSVKVRSIMANALLDFGNEDGLSFYAGVGAGRARVKLLGDSDSAWAGQLIAGLRYAISPNVDVGLKYRYFRTGKVNFGDDATSFAGNPNRTVLVGNVPFVDQTTNAVVFTDFEQKFRSHSLLASLIFNFGHAAEAPPPPPPPPPPPEPVAPATQTCADGSVILATDICPAPPPPPPPPPEAVPERG